MAEDLGPLLAHVQPRVIGIPERVNRPRHVLPAGVRPALAGGHAVIELVGRVLRVGHREIGGIEIGSVDKLQSFERPEMRALGIECLELGAPACHVGELVGHVEVARVVDAHPGWPAEAVGLRRVAWLLGPVYAALLSEGINELRRGARHVVEADVLRLADVACQQAALRINGKSRRLLHAGDLTALILAVERVGADSECCVAFLHDPQRTRLVRDHLAGRIGFRRQPEFPLAGHGCRIENLDGETLRIGKKQFTPANGHPGQLLTALLGGRIDE